MNKFKKFAMATTAGFSSLLMTAAPVLAQLGEIDPPETGYASSLGGLISSLLTLVMIIAAILVFLYLIMGGIEWITSGGDKSKTEGARNKITAAIVGLVILAASYALLQFALNFLGFDGLSGVFDSLRPITDN